MRGRGAMGLLCAVAALPACAASPIYKWVDAGGITNYGDRAPVQGRARVLRPEESRVSVYTYDPLLRDALAAERERMVSDLRTARRQRDLEREWLARQYFAALRGSERNSCCASTAWTSPGVVFGAAPPQTVPQIQLPPGATAGNITGSSGYIPGTSAFAPPASANSHPVLERARSGVVLRVN